MHLKEKPLTWSSSELFNVFKKNPPVLEGLWNFFHTGALQNIACHAPDGRLRFCPLLTLLIPSFRVSCGHFFLPDPQERIVNGTNHSA